MTDYKITLNGASDSFGRKLTRTTDGYLHCIYRTNTEENIWRLTYAKSADNGTTWQENIISGDVSRNVLVNNVLTEVLTYVSDPSIVSDSNNNLHVIWTENYIMNNQGSISPQTSVLSFLEILREYAISLYIKKYGKRPLVGFPLQTVSEVVQFFFALLPASFWNGLPSTFITTRLTRPNPSVLDPPIPNELYLKFPTQFLATFSTMVDRNSAKQSFAQEIYLLANKDQSTINNSESSNETTSLISTNKILGSDIFYNKYSSSWSGITNISGNIYALQNSYKASGYQPQSHTPIMSIDSDDNLHIIWADSGSGIDRPGTMSYIRKSPNENFGPYGPNYRIIGVGSPLAMTIDGKGYIHFVYKDNGVVTYEGYYFSGQIFDSFTDDSLAGKERLIYSRMKDLYHRDYAICLSKGSYVPHSSICVDNDNTAHIVWNQDTDNSGTNSLYYNKISSSSLSSDLSSTLLFASSSRASICLDSSYIYVFSDYNGDISYRKFGTSWTSESKIFVGNSVGGYSGVNALFSAHPYATNIDVGNTFIFSDTTNQQSAIRYYKTEDLSFVLIPPEITSPVVTIEGSSTINTSTNNSNTTVTTTTISAINEDGTTTTTETVYTRTINDDGTITETTVITDTTEITEGTITSVTTITSITGGNGQTTEIVQSITTPTSGNSIGGTTTTTTVINSDGTSTTTSSMSLTQEHIPTPSTLVSIDGYMYKVINSRWSLEADAIIIKYMNNGNTKEIIPPSEYTLLPRKGLVVFKNNMMDLSDAVYKIHIINPYVFRPALKIINSGEDYIRIYGTGYMYNEVGDIPQVTTGINLCSLRLNSVGMFGGYDQTFDVTDNVGFSLIINYDMYDDADRVLIYVDNVLEYDSGCITGGGTFDVAIPAVATSVRMQLIPNCSQIAPTQPHWTINTNCIDFIS